MHRELRWAAAAVLALAAATAQAVPVYANGAAGDSLLVPGPRLGAPVGSSGWYYNNVGGGGEVGINGLYANDTNGAVTMKTGFASSKADIEYLGANAVNIGGVYYSITNLGNFSAFTGMSYEWYRDAASSNYPAQHPSLRVLLDLDGNVLTGNDRIALIYEQVYNGIATAATNAWQSATVGGSTQLWASGALGLEPDLDNDGDTYETLDEWKTYGQLANAVVVGFSSGVGSGWDGYFQGAVDKISWTIGDVTTETNFEVSPAAVPEPGSIALVGLSLAALAYARRRTASI